MASPVASGLATPVGELLPCTYLTGMGYELTPFKIDGVEGHALHRRNDPPPCLLPEAQKTLLPKISPWPRTTMSVDKQSLAKVTAFKEQRNVVSSNPEFTLAKMALWSLVPDDLLVREVIEKYEAALAMRHAEFESLRLAHAAELQARAEPFKQRVLELEREVRKLRNRYDPKVQSEAGTPGWDVHAASAGSVNRERGPAPLPFTPTTSDEAGARGGRRKREAARNLFERTREALGGQVRLTAAAISHPPTNT